MSIKLDGLKSINLYDLSRQNTVMEKQSSWRPIAEAKINGKNGDVLKYFYKSNGQGDLEIIIKRYNHIPKIVLVHMAVRDGFVEHADKGYNLKHDGKEIKGERELLIQKEHANEKYAVAKRMHLKEALRYIQNFLRKEYKPLKKGLQYIGVD